MHRFYADECGVADGMARLADEDARHALRVLRLGEGDEIELIAPPQRFLARIERADEAGVLESAQQPLPPT